MSSQPQVIEALRKFLPGLDRESFPLFKPACQRAIWAFENCRTSTLGWKRHHCEHCDRSHFSFHSCNHKSCPQCGKLDTAKWVRRQLQKKICCDYYMITFTLPTQLRGCFQCEQEKLIYDLFFQAASKALATVLRNKKWLGAQHNGFMMVLHTWNQLLQFHPHIHTILPAAGLDANEQYIEHQSSPRQSGKKDYLLPYQVLRNAFRGNFHRLYLKLRKEHPTLPMPHGSVWSLPWGINIKPVSNGERAIKYLARYVNRTAISDSRILKMDQSSVTFKWKDRANGDVQKIKTLDGAEFTRRFLLHVLPQGLRSIRYYGFCHPAGKKRFEKIAFHSGCNLFSKPDDSSEQSETSTHQWSCPCCSHQMTLVETIFAPYCRSAPKVYHPSALQPKHGPDP